MDLTFARPGAMGDQDMATFDDADWSEESHMDECDPGAPLDIVAEASNRRYDDFSHWAFVQKLRLQVLPNDEEHREDFRIGDPNVHFQAAAAKPYETSGATGKPKWASLFGFILARMSHLRFLSTVYVLVDNRDLTNLDNLEPFSVTLACCCGLLVQPCLHAGSCPGAL